MFTVYKKKTRVHVMQKCRLCVKLRVIASLQWLQLAGEFLKRPRILSCSCCILKQYLDEANDPNFAKSLNFFFKIDEYWKFFMNAVIDPMQVLTRNMISLFIDLRGISLSIRCMLLYL